jgi:hypothetical protein
MIENQDIFSPHSDAFLLSRKFPGMTVERAQLARRFCSKVAHDIDDEDLLAFLQEARYWDLSGAVGEHPPFSLDSSAELQRALDFVSNWLASADAYDDYLHELAATDLVSYTALYEAEFALHQNEEAGRRKQFDATQAFSKPSATARFEYWKKMAVWSPHEAVTLSLGKEPGSVFSGSMLAHKAFSWFAAEYMDRLSLLERAIEAGPVAERMAPATFLDWARSFDWSLPEELSGGITSNRVDLEQQLAERQVALEAAQERIKKLEHLLQAKRLISLDKLVVGMARLRWFGNKNFQPTKIAQDLDKHPSVRLGNEAVRDAIADAMTRLEIQLSDLYDPD